MDESQGAAPDAVVLSLIRDKLEPLRQDIDDLMRKMRLVERALSLTKLERVQTGSNGDGNENTTSGPDARGERRGPSTAFSSTDAVGNLATTRRTTPSLVILRENDSSSARRRITPVKDDSWEENTSRTEHKEETRQAGIVGRDLHGVQLRCNLTMILAFHLFLP